MSLLHVDPDALDKISRSMASAGTNLDSASSSTPTSIDGGCGTPAILGILAKLVDDTGQLAVAVKAVGDGVASASTSYRGQDEAAADSLNHAMWTG
ncbi:hypothetical protein [Mycolicibacterium sp. HK-90]|uniref:hypothetical protein n=1 Tax=Mycolicibacterium sp. HK-90 TaxID=3056937 RepID=UPI00265B349C|nr:hypothetical protein [Mycolicibacterium sp. HK-90]WKG05094.1 hypothetical protein QU592_08430 [Mycolicibacterium sp. HK-90]